MKLAIYDGKKTYMYPSGALATPETVQADFPAIRTFPHVVTTDENEEVFFAVENFAAMRSRNKIPAAYSEEEALAALTEIVNAPPAIPEPSAEDVQASLAALTELQGLEDSERKHSAEDPVAYTQLQAHYANYYARGLWTKRAIALAVQKGRLTVEQFKDITGEEYDPDCQTAPMRMEEALNEMGVKAGEENLVEQAQAIRAGMRALATSAPDDVLLTTTQALYDIWVAGKHFDYNQPLTHNGQLYRVAQAGGVDALETQPPDAEGMLAVYRPVDAVHAGTLEDPIPWVYGMDCDEGKYYAHNGGVYLCNADMHPCTWEPGTEGLWQWTLQEEGEA